jgi:hypothetical protein
VYTSKRVQGQGLANVAYYNIERGRSETKESKNERMKERKRKERKIEASPRKG